MTYDDDPRSDVDRITGNCIVSQGEASLCYTMADRYRNVNSNRMSSMWQERAALSHEDAKYYLDQLLYPVKEG